MRCNYMYGDQVSLSFYSGRSHTMLCTNSYVPLDPVMLYTLPVYQQLRSTVPTVDPVILLVYSHYSDPAYQQLHSTGPSHTTSVQPLL